MSPPPRTGLNLLINKPHRTQGCLDDEVRPSALPSLLSTTPALHLLATAGQEREIALKRQQLLPGIRSWRPRKSPNAAPKFPPSSSPPFSPPNSSGNPWAKTPAAHPSPVPATTPTRGSSGGPAASPPLRPQFWGSVSARMATAAAGPSALAPAPPPPLSDDGIRYGDPGSFEEQVERMRRLTDGIALQEKRLDTLKGREQAARDAQACTVTQRMAQSAERRQRIETALKVRPAAVGGEGSGGGRGHRESGRPHLPPAASTPRDVALHRSVVVPRDSSGLRVLCWRQVQPSPRSPLHWQAQPKVSAAETAAAEAADAAEAAWVEVANAAAEAPSTCDELHNSLAAAATPVPPAAATALREQLARAEAALARLVARLLAEERARGAARRVLAVLDEACTVAQLWGAEGEEAAQMRLEMRPEESAVLAPLLLAVCEARRRVRVSEARAGAPRVLAEALPPQLAAARAQLPANVAAPRGSRTVHNRPLTAEEEAIADEYLVDELHDPDEVINDVLNFAPVSRLKIRCLKPTEWLNDEVINFCMGLLKARGDAATEADALPRCHFFTSMFYPKLYSDKSVYEYTAVKRWTRKVDVFTKDLLICPIHCHGNHWTLAVVNLLDKRFEYFDSLSGGDGGVLANLRRYIKDEHLDKKKASWDDTGWTEHTWRAGTPRQRNGWDCGVFCCKTADYLAQDAVLDFSQARRAPAASHGRARPPPPATTRHATRHPPPTTRHPPPATRHPPPATRHPPPRLPATRHLRPSDAAGARRTTCRTSAAALSSRSTTRRC